MMIQRLDIIYLITLMRKKMIHAIEAFVLEVHKLKESI